ncbi:fibronectin type III domain-containing protein [Microgenomates group bacterium]|nr:fibronectin type III domain-containing protein [Microgenomates group bacterium]
MKILKFLVQIISVLVIATAGFASTKIQAQQSCSINLSASGSEVAVSINRSDDCVRMRFRVSEASVLSEVRFNNNIGEQLLFFDGNSAVMATPYMTTNFVLRMSGSVSKDFSLSAELLDRDGNVLSNTSSVSFAGPAVPSVSGVPSSPSESNANDNNNDSNESSNGAGMVNTEGQLGCAVMTTPDLFQIRTNVDRATLFWKPVAGAVSYKISYGYRNGKVTTITIPSPTTTPNLWHTIWGLEAQKTYRFTMVAIDGCGTESRVSVALAAKTYNRAANFYKYK